MVPGGGQVRKRRIFSGMTTRMQNASAIPDVFSDGLQTGPEVYHLADWRLRMNALYAAIRSSTDIEQGWHLWRDTRRLLFRSHPMSPISASERDKFIGPEVFSYNPELRFLVDLQPIEGSIEAVDLGRDGVLERRPIARTSGLVEALSTELTLYWIEGYGGGLFLPFKDLTAGSLTYGGGRYLIDAIKGADLGLDPDGRLILDFNFAYHPSCAHNPAYVCPLAPSENVLSHPVPAGERF